jgi:ABC-type Fe3+ transport system permease subunit
MLLTVWAAAISVVITMAVNMAVGGADGSMARRWTSPLQRRLTQLRSTRDAGLTTVEVAIITAVLLGLATALVAAITVVVNRNTSKIQ